MASNDLISKHITDFLITTTFWHLQILLHNRTYEYKLSNRLLFDLGQKMSDFQPQLLIYNDEIDIIEHESDINDLLYSVDDKQKETVVLLDKKRGYLTLAGRQAKERSSEELAELVKNYLVKEGQCCLGKIDTLTPAQAFTLLAID